MYLFNYFQFSTLTHDVNRPPHYFITACSSGTSHEKCIWRAAAIGVPGLPNCTQLGRELTPADCELTPTDRGGVAATAAAFAAAADSSAATAAAAAAAGYVGEACTAPLAPGAARASCGVTNPVAAYGARRDDGQTDRPV